MSILFVVPSERHVERLAREGEKAETRASLSARLLRTLLPDVVLADARTSRMVLGEALSDPGGAAKQLRLFAEAAEGRVQDTVLAALREGGGTSWVRTVLALDRAITDLAKRGATADLLEKVAKKERGVVAARAHVLGAAMRARDERLAAISAVDERLAPRALARALVAMDPGAVARAVGGSDVRARWIVGWDAADLTWFRALDDRLSAVRGSARIVLFGVERRLEGSRERDALETLADDVARALDAPPELETIAPLLFADAPLAPDRAARVSVIAAQDASAQARVVVEEVSSALAAGTPLDRIAVACPSFDEGAVGPLRRALEDAGLVVFDGRGVPPSRSPVVAVALGALALGKDLAREAVAALASSGFVDGPRLAPEGTPPRDATKALARVAHNLTMRATARGDRAATRLVRTAAPDGGLEAEIVAKLAAVLETASAASTRATRIHAARVLWGELGLGARAGRGGLTAFADDEPPVGVPRAERHAIARDARAWEALLFALDEYEAAALRTGAGGRAVDDGVFRAELETLVDELGLRGAGARAGAIRLVRIGDLPGDALDLLVVVDAVDGVLPHDGGGDALASRALMRALAKAGRGSFADENEDAARARQLVALAAGSSEVTHAVVVYTREDCTGAPVAPATLVEHLLRAGAHSRTSTPVRTRRRSADARVRAEREAVREGFFLDPARPRSELVGDLDARRTDAGLVLRAATGGGEEALAVTSLERFARCAFEGFVHVVLAGREATRPDELPDAREEGNLAHAALAAAFEATASLWAARPRDVEAIQVTGLRAAVEALEAAAAHAKLRAVTTLRVRDAVRAVLELAVADEGWDFGAAEQAFGASGRRAGTGPLWPALVFEAEGERLALRGSIDRVDLAHGRNAVRVVDYKRSRSTVKSSSKDLGETALQVPLYAAVAARELGREASGAYVAFQPRDVKESTRGASEVEARVAALAHVDASGLSAIGRKALAVVASARSGALAPMPVRETTCTFCAASGVCRKPRFAMAPEEDEEPT